MTKLIKYLCTAKLVYVVIGFVIGASVTDQINTRIYSDRLNIATHDVYDFGCLILAYVERPEYCPMCHYNFHYFYSYTQDELQDMIDSYLGELSYYQDNKRGDNNGK